MTILYTPNPSMAEWIVLAVTLLLPLLVGLVTKASEPGGLKAVLLLALSAATAFGYALLAVKGETDIWPLVRDTLTTFIIAVAMHFGLWKPTTATAVAQSSLRKDAA